MCLYLTLVVDYLYFLPKKGGPLSKVWTTHSHIPATESKVDLSFTIEKTPGEFSLKSLNNSVMAKYH